jgi:hypothetical protein
LTGVRAAIYADSVILILGMVLRVIVALLFLRLVLRAVAPLFVSKPAARPRAVTAGDLVRDFVCNTFVPRDRAVRAIVAGEEQLFCSDACADRARSS